MGGGGGVGGGGGGGGGPESVSRLPIPVPISFSAHKRTVDGVGELVDGRIHQLLVGEVRLIAALEQPARQQAHQVVERVRGPERLLHHRARDARPAQRAQAVAAEAESSRMCDRVARVR